MFLASNPMSSIVNAKEDAMGHNNVFSIKCKVCGKERQVSRHWAKYCGNTCKAIAWGVKAEADLKRAKGGSK